MNDEPLVLSTPSLTIHRVAGPRVASHVFLAMYGFAGVCGVLGALGEDVTTIMLPWLVSMLGWIVLFGSYVASLTPVWSAGMVEVRPLGVTFTLARGSARHVQRSEIAGALVVPRRMGDGSMSTVEIETVRGDRFTVALSDPEDARRLVERLGFGPGGMRVRSRLARPSRRLLNPLLGALAWIGGMLVAAVPEALFRAKYPYNQIAYMGVWPLFTVGLYLLLRRFTRPTEVVVGEDAVVVERRGRRRVIPRKEIEATGALPIGTLLVDEERVEAVRHLVSERTAPTGVADDALATFAREGRSPSEWRDQLRVKMERSGYREAATSVDVAGAVLRSGRASPEERVGAAVALRVAGEPPSRIRVAAEAVADEGLRAALEAIADDADDARVEKALRSVR